VGDKLTSRDIAALVVLHALVSRSDGVASALVSFGDSQSEKGAVYLARLRAACFNVADWFLTDEGKR